MMVELTQWRARCVAVPCLSASKRSRAHDFQSSDVEPFPDDEQRTRRPTHYH